MAKGFRTFFSRMAEFIQLHKDKYWFRLKRYLMGILKSDKSDKTIAWSYSLGTFVAVFPTPGFSTLIGLALLGMFKQLNKMAVLLSMAIWNGLTVVPVYWFSFKIGQSLSFTEPITFFSNNLINDILFYFKSFILGNLFITVPVSVLSYFIAKVLLRYARIKRERRALEKMRNYV